MLEQGSWGKSWAVRLTLDGIIYKPFHWQSWTDWEKQQSSLRDDGKKIEWIPNIRFSSFILNQFELQIPIWFTNSKFSFSMFNIYTDINLMLKAADVEATSAAWICCLLLKPAVIPVSSSHWMQRQRSQALIAKMWGDTEMNILFQLTHSILDNVTAHSNIIHLIKAVSLSHFFAVILLNNKINSLSLIGIGILHFG